MAVAKKVLLHPQERLDLPDVLSLQDLIEEDLQYFNKGFLSGDSNYVISGFEVSKTGNLAAEVAIASSALLRTEGTDSLAGTFYLAPAGSTALPVALTDNATNYIHLKVTRNQDSQDVRVFWNQTANSGQGAEWQQVVNTENNLEFELYVSTSAFSTNPIYVPIAEITTAGGTYASSDIKDRRNMFFRLGAGYPYNPYVTKELTTLSEDETDFSSADRELTCLKDWMDLVMSEIKEIKFGATAASWWEPAPSSLLSGKDLLTEGGTWTWDLWVPAATIVAYTVVDNAHIVAPAINFTGNGTGGGAVASTFEVGSVAGLSVGDAIQIQGTAAPVLDVVIHDIAGAGAPYTITVEVAELSFDADAVVLIANSPYVNTIEFAVDSPIITSDNQIAYVDLDRNSSATVSVTVVDASAYISNTNRLIVARRVGHNIYVGGTPLVLTPGDTGSLSTNVSDLTNKDYSGAVNAADTTPDYSATVAGLPAPNTPPNFIIDDVDNLTTAIAKLDYYMERLVPIGTILPFYDFNAALSFDPLMYAYCDGSAAVVKGIGAQTLPDLSGRYLTGFGTDGGGDIDTAAWTTAAIGNMGHTINIQHTHTVASHNHTGPSHSHTISGHTHVSASHAHSSGTLKFRTMYWTLVGTAGGQPAYQFYCYQTSGVPRRFMSSGMGLDTGGSNNCLTTQSDLFGWGGLSGAGDIAYTHDGTGTTGTGGGLTTSSTALTTNSAGTGVTGNASPATDAQLSTTQTIRPRSIRVRYIMRIA